MIICARLDKAKQGAYAWRSLSTRKKQGMQGFRKTLPRVVLVGMVLLATTAQAQQPSPLPIEKIGIIETLPKVYPESWFLVHDAAFFGMSDGKAYIVDVAAETLASQIKGSFNVVLMGNIIQSAQRSEIYATETFHTRGTRGNRLDVLTIWDQENLSPIGEITLPGNKRFMGIPGRYTMLLLNQGRWLAVANFGPAASATLIDLNKRKIINQIATPGCVFTYPTGRRGFSSLCADGRFLSTELNVDGKITKQTRSKAFFNSDESPIYERPAVIGKIAYFPSIAGFVHPVDISTTVARPGQPWHLVPEDEQKENWAPAGIGIIDKDDNGRFYILMHPDAKDGSYQSGGPEVWVFDVAIKARIKRIVLQEWGLSLAVSRGKRPVLMVVNPVDMSLEIYNPETGKFIRKIDDFGEQTPLMVQSSK